MVLGGTALKLVSLAVKTAAKPLAKRFKASAESSPFWRSVFVRYAQWHYKMEYQITVKMLGHHTRNVKPLEENKAVQLGSEVLSEAFVFGVAGAMVVFEYNRSQISAAEKKDKEEKALAEKETQLELRLQGIETSLLALKEEIQGTKHAVSGSISEIIEEIDDLKKK
eukprot:TRINITY_DN3467_c0_g1_i1.p1 TRINITY_DN3467_c0_g1~~TRINITY_DN3467_c0_g1_i1.p1  ORF type:complete len:167 (-),score=58.95 TRINITY_DN3467_c0_g1_i1:28-528(-)